MIDRNHPAVEAAARAALDDGWTCDTHEPRPWGDCPDCTASHLHTAPAVLSAALPHLTADDLRDTPAGKQLMREAAVNDRSPHPHWLSTPYGTLYDANLPGDEARARNIDARRLEAMQSMRESDEGRSLMAEGWERGYSSGEEDGWIKCDDPGAYDPATNPYRTEVTP